MQSYRSPGENITLAAPAAVLSGQPALIGAIFGVAQGAAAAGEEVVWLRRGLFELPKVAAQPWALGAKLYWDAAAGVVTSTAAGNVLIGAAAAAATNPSAQGLVLLDGTIR